MYSLQRLQFSSFQFRHIRMIGVLCKNRESMALRFFLILLRFIACFTATHGEQLFSTEVFISIDCGSASNTSYSDSNTNLQYVSDEQFIDAGVNYNVSSFFYDTNKQFRGPGRDYEIASSSSLEKQLVTLRSFPEAPRSCYALRPVTQFNKYLVRAMFFYGNYDGKNTTSEANPLQFDLHIDVNLWQTVNITDPADILPYEAIVVALGDSISVCLVNTGSGTPFISVLELRPLGDGIDMYPAANGTQYLDLAYRYDFLGPDRDHFLIRYPADPYDRFWFPLTRPNWTDVSTTKTLFYPPDDVFHPPMTVMQTAVAPANSSVLEIAWTFADAEAPNNEFYVNVFFGEPQLNDSPRTFDAYLNGELLATIRLDYLSMSVLYTTSPLNASSLYQWALNSTGESSFPPILNAAEVYSAMHLSQAATDWGDVDAINAIKKQYQVKRNWMGDPCAPKQYLWAGLNCSYKTIPIRIADVNLSSSALSGEISSSFANLTEIMYLDLSYNNLTGRIPDALGTLPLLQVLNLTGNNLIGTIPYSLLERSKQGSLILRYDGNPNLCTNQASCKSNKLGRNTIVILSLVPAVLVLLFVVLFVRWRARTKSQPVTDSPPNRIKGHQNILLQLENRNFTYKELEKITKRFTNVLGKGGFGSVFLGCLEDGTQVAVKMRSQTSSQGAKEFLAEAQNLTKIHHKNLVSLVGYCLDKDHLALVYEFMSKGTLQDNLRGETQSAAALSWVQRINIAVEAAQGLEYLHKGIKPPIIHRDVKSSNILLGESLETKIADFGLSRTFNDHNKLTHVSTAVVGTPGYLDPEYYSSFQLSEKSDVYSFGVVLFELITGQLPVFQIGDALYTSLAQWAREKLAANGYTEDIVDARLQGQSNLNSIGKAAAVALSCIEPAARTRPTMSEVVVELRESLTMEVSFQRLKSLTTTASTSNTFPGSSSYVSASCSSTSPLEVEL